MLSQCCYLLESEAQALLRSQGYKVHILPKTHRKNSLPLCVVAFSKTGETRTIRIKKALRTPRGLNGIEARYANEIRLFRKMLARTPTDPDQHYEIWCYTEKNGFFCCEVLPDTLQEIPAPVSASTGVQVIAPGCPMITGDSP